MNSKACQAPLAAILACMLLCVLPSCTSTLTRDATRLAELPPLPYRVAVVGGAFVPEGERGAVGRKPEEQGQGFEELWTRSFSTGVSEPIAFGRVLAVLQRGRMATRTLSFAASARDEREALSAGDAAAIEVARSRAEAVDADLMLVLEGVRDGPVQYLGVTAQWPITTVAWLLAGIGLFIPDHRFQSRAKLRASILDVHSGQRLLSQWSFSTVPIELSLLDRSDFLGIASSIIIPPTLVSSDVETVVSAVRKDAVERLVLELLARLKDIDTLDALRAEMPTRVELARRGRGVEVSLRSRQELQGVVVQTFDASGARRELDPSLSERFVSTLLSSARIESGRFVYGARFDWREADAEFRVIVEDVAGRRASASVGR